MGAKNLQHTGAISDNFHIMINKNELKKRYASAVYYVRKSEQEKEGIRKLMDMQCKLEKAYQQEYINAQESAEIQLAQMKIAEQDSEKEVYDFAQRAYKTYKKRVQKMQFSSEEASNQLKSLKKIYHEMDSQLKIMKRNLMKQMNHENIDILDNPLKLFVI
ncbi:hypothetical protein [Oceanobacillus neutriphilus]|uniref:Uncharacterized protein n=1 Tax=Oceanobacillus neutriphilus TaxID=531815 RepID=A0ABQ2NT79_9BACI|nr:hypothetical protein [Oceanobacillus neutriphilus]GGP09733.1 hypothetical protein GCM10011346_15020 [Oceanobacillus neutriphilus]